MNWLSQETITLLLRGLLYTVLLTAITSVLSLVVGVLVGTMRLSGRPFLARAAGVYVNIFRNVPALLLIIFLAFAVPNLFAPQQRQALFFDNLLADWSGSISGLPLPYYALAVIVALTLNSSAYLAELFRAGVGTIPQQIVDAARSLGATRTAVFWQILLPQGVLAAFPAMTTRLIHNMKNTALASFVAVPEFFHATQASVTRTFFALQFLLLAAFVYLLLALAFAALLRQIERWIDPQVGSTKRKQQRPPVKVSNA
jgi:His/Glu/Gln/Arg/opine family amino acid ABC transporter permease subunit